MDRLSKVLVQASSEMMLSRLDSSFGASVMAPLAEVGAGRPGFNESSRKLKDKSPANN